MKLLITTVILFAIISAAFAKHQPLYNDSARLQSLLKLSRADSVRKDYLSALKHLNQYLNLKDSLLDVIKEKQLGQLEVKYQSAKKDLNIQSKEKNIELLTSRNILMNSNILQAKSIRRTITGIVIVVALLLVAGYLQYHLKQRANLRLQSQQNAIDQQNDSLQNLAWQKDTLLEEKELLIKEIHHRVKNNLQVVISLLNTQSAYLDDPRAAAAIRQSQHRMQSISLIHQKLYQSESRALVNMKEYTHELVRYLQQSYEKGSRIAFKLTIEDIELDVLRAVPLGLIINEAITNAIKYAFPDYDNGVIEIELNCKGENQLELKIMDNGLGLPVEFNVNVCQSLGINLIKGMCKQINGRLALQNKNGLLVAIEFPNDIQHINDASNDDIPSFDEGHD